jgi:hypothetical protein
MSRALPDYSSIRDLAMVDPVSAYAILMGVPRVPFSASMVASFSALTVGGTPISASLDQEIYQRTWIEGFSYQLQMPQSFPGQILKTQWDAGLKQAPNCVSAQFQVQGGPKYLANPEFVPLENWVDIFHTSWPRGWPIYKFQSMLGLFVLTAIPGGNNAPPLNVTVTMRGWQFLDPSAEEIPADTCARRLRAAGFCVPGDLSSDFYTAQDAQAARRIARSLGLSGADGGVGGVEGAPEDLERALNIPTTDAHNGKPRDTRPSGGRRR